MKKNNGAVKKSSISKLLFKYSKLTHIQKVSIWMWVSCMFLLFAFVGIAVFWSESTKEPWITNLLTTFGLFFILDIFFSLLSTVIPQVVKKKVGGKK